MITSHVHSKGQQADAALETQSVCLVWHAEHTRQSNRTYENATCHKKSYSPVAWNGITAANWL